METRKEIVLVTGSSGCLGQFIVKLLQERDDRVGEIRLFDKIKYVNDLGHEEGKTMTEFIADIRDPERLEEAFEGVNCVIHAAAYQDVRVIPDVKTLESVNVDGTRAVVAACLRMNVSRLVFASTMEVTLGLQDVLHGSEETTSVPKRFRLGKYSETKHRGEELVSKASGELCANGRTVLRTVILRPIAFYGEHDKVNIIKAVQLAKVSGGCYYRVKSSKNQRCQNIYIGNAAWAFLKAKDRLAADKTISGETFFITDDTPVVDFHEFVVPYVEARGFKISPCVIPYWFAWALLSAICLLVKMVNMIVRVQFDLPGTNMLSYSCSTIFYDGRRGKLRLDYRPIYTPEEARQRSLPFYKNAEL